MAMAAGSHAAWPGLAWQHAWSTALTALHACCTGCLAPCVHPQGYSQLCASALGGSCWAPEYLGLGPHQWQEAYRATKGMYEEAYGGGEGVFLLGGRGGRWGSVARGQ